MRIISSPNYGGTRGKVIWIIIHTAEGATTVDSLGNYFAKTTAQASSHVGIDDREVVQYVPYEQTAWTARSANPYADQAELCGFAAWTRDQWLAHPGMLENTALWIADRCKARGIPAIKRSPLEVAARTPGVIGHIDVTLGLKDGTHTDPGKSFPWDVVMPRVNAILAGKPSPTPSGDDDMNAAQEAVLQGILNWIVDPNIGIIKQIGDIQRALGMDDPDKNGQDRLGDLWQQADRNKADLLAAILGQSSGKVDAASIAAAIPADMAKQVADELVKRLSNG